MVVLVTIVISFTELSFLDFSIDCIKSRVSLVSENSEIQVIFYVVHSKMPL